MATSLYLLDLHYGLDSRSAVTAPIFPRLGLLVIAYITTAGDRLGPSLIHTAMSVLASPDVMYNSALLRIGGDSQTRARHEFYSYRVLLTSVMRSGRVAQDRKSELDNHDLLHDSHLLKYISWWAASGSNRGP